MTDAAPIAAGIGGVAFFLVTGAAVADLLPGLRALPRSFRLGLAYLLGVACVGGAVHFVSFAFGVPLGRPMVLAVAAVPVGAAIVRRARSRAVPRSRNRGRQSDGMLVAFIAALGGLVSLSLFAEALANPVNDFDGRMTWGPPARAIAFEGTVLPRVIREARWSLTRRGYPVLMPVAQAIVLTTFEGDDDRAVRPLYAAFYPTFLLVLFGGASRLAGRRAAAAVTLLAALLPFLAFARNGGASGTYSDFPLGCFWGAALLLFVAGGKAPSTALAAGVLFAAAVLTKNEGAFLAAFGLAAVAVSLVAPFFRSGARHRATVFFMRRFLPAAAPPPFAVALLLLWRREIGGTPDRNYAAIVSASALLRGVLTNGSAIARAMGTEMLDIRAWGLFFPAALALLIVGARPLRRKPARVLLLAIAGAVVTYLGAYALTERADVAPFVKDTWNRFVLQMSLPLLTLLALAIRDGVRSRGRGQVRII